MTRELAVMKIPKSRTGKMRYLLSGLLLWWLGAPLGLILIIWFFIWVIF